MTIIVYLIQNLVKSQQAKNCNKCKSVKSLKSVKSVTILKICGIRRIRIASIGLTRRSRRDDPLYHGTNHDIMVQIVGSWY